MGESSVFPQTLDRSLPTLPTNKKDPAMKFPFSGALISSRSIPPRLWGWGMLTVSLTLTGCFHHGTRAGAPPYDRPFPLGQVTDSFWETQQTNAEAADFIFYDHEFVDDTAQLGPGAKRHLESVALRLEHVPFPVVIEQSVHDAKPDMDQARRRMIVEQLARMGVPDSEGRVIIAPAFAEGFTAIEGERAYSSVISGFGNGRMGGGRGFGGSFR
jgi:hypothetical protein